MVVEHSPSSGCPPRANLSAVAHDCSNDDDQTASLTVNNGSTKSLETLWVRPSPSLG